MTCWNGLDWTTPFFCGRYFKGLPIWYSKNPRNGFCIGKKLRGLSSLLQKDCKWIVSNGQSVNLWFDNWIDHDPIASWFLDSHFSEKDCIAGIIEENGWLIPGHVPTELQVFLANSIRSISLGDNSVSDHFSWKGNSYFSIWEAWHLLRSKVGELPWAALVWSKFFSPRLSCLS